MSDSDSSDDESKKLFRRLPAHLREQSMMKTYDLLNGGGATAYVHPDAAPPPPPNAHPARCTLHTHPKAPSPHATPRAPLCSGEERWIEGREAGHTRRPLPQGYVLPPGVGITYKRPSEVRVPAAVSTGHAPQLGFRLGTANDRA